MRMDFLQRYLIIINIVSFVIQTIDFKLYIHGGKGIKAKVLLKLATIFGGALGSILAEAIWNGKRNKSYLKLRLHTVMWLIIQLALYIIIYGSSNQGIRLWSIDLYLHNKLLCIYLLLINIITFILFALDKIKALLGRWRIRELALLGLGIIGGSIGGLLAMDIFNHKVKVKYFRIGFPIMLIVHLIVLWYIVI